MPLVIGMVDPHTNLIKGAFFLPVWFSFSGQILFFFLLSALQCLTLMPFFKKPILFASLVIVGRNVCAYDP